MSVLKFFCEKLIFLYKNVSIKFIDNCFTNKKQGMQSNITGRNYNKYSFEDFLQDDFFISSVNNPTEETVKFWNNFVEENSENLYNYNSAKLYIESFPVTDDFLSEKEVMEMWRNIDTRNIINSKRRSRRIYLITTSVAAGVAALLIGLFFNNDNSQESEIYMYASQTQTSGMNSSNAQLILSEDKVVEIEDKESEITYESATIKVKGEDISKNEIASYNELTVPKGKRSMLTFSEGTKVWVNAGTRVVYPAEFNSKEREIYVDGEIYIEVSHNKDWPFIVQTKDIGIQVLGTAFNVTAYESDLAKRVVLASGSVRITTKNKNEDLLLSPNKMYENDNGQNKIVDVDVNKYISWKDGMYIYDNEKLINILTRLSTYYGIDINCDDVAANLKCSGKLDLKNDLKDVLVGLTYTAPVLFQENDGLYIINYQP